MIWKRLETCKIVTSEGESDIIHFEHDNESGYRIINDYGNECITFDTMTGVKALGRILNKMNNSINSKLNEEINCSIENNNFLISADCEGN